MVVIAGNPPKVQISSKKRINIIHHYLHGYPRNRFAGILKVDTTFEYRQSYSKQQTTFNQCEILYIDW